jgi:hypothetical protein
VAFSGGELRLALGAARARRWAEKITKPRSVMDKLGIKPGMRIGVVGRSDAALCDELRARGAEVRAGAVPDEADVVFLLADKRDDLAQLRALQKPLRRSGAIWVIRPKGAAAIHEKDVLEAGRAAGLVDTKVVGFSATHTAAKLLIPVARR